MAAGTRVGAFAAALVCGVIVPLSPLLAEYIVTHEVTPNSWSAVGVTYVAGVGLVSRDKNVLVFGLCLAGMLAFLYGVDMEDAYAHMRLHAEGALRPHALPVVKWIILTATLEYGIERAMRHLLGGKPFLEA